VQRLRRVSDEYLLSVLTPVDRAGGQGNSPSQ